MSVQGAGGPIQGSWNISHQNAGQTSLSSEVTALLNQTMGFKGAKVIDVSKGLGPVAENMQIQMDAKLQGLVQSEVAQILGLHDPVDSVLIMIGGSALVKEEMEKLKQKLRKIDEERVKQLAQLLGISTDQDVLIVAEDGSDIRPGGYFIISGGMRELNESIDD